MACKRYLEFNGAYLCLDVPVLRRKFVWPPDPPEWPEWFKNIIEEISGPDSRRQDILDGVRLPGVEQGSWSRDLTRVVAISELVEGFESPELREQFAGLLHSTSDDLLRANAPEVRVELSV
ncbi:hypothetical protein [Micropruina sp.]|uniref:hypothetical protein n=1 Tax=Micropruina sp. TaxID=2737536 RepID=UPI0039E6D088